MGHVVQAGVADIVSLGHLVPVVLVEGVGM